MPIKVHCWWDDALQRWAVCVNSAEGGQLFYAQYKRERDAAAEALRQADKYGTIIYGGIRR